MEFTARELMAHPQFQQIALDLKLKREQDQLLQIADKLEAARLREEAGRVAKTVYELALEEYEEQRVKLHAALGQVFLANLGYQRVTGVPVPSYPEKLVLAVNTPSLKPDAGQWLSDTSTGTMAVQAFFSNQRWS